MKKECIAAQKLGHSRKCRDPKLNFHWLFYANEVILCKWGLITFSLCSTNIQRTNIFTSPVATGGFWGLAPPNKLQASPNWIMKHYKSVKFLSNFRMSSPLNKRTASLLKTLWRWFWSLQLLVHVSSKTLPPIIENRKRNRQNSDTSGKTYFEKPWNHNHLETCKFPNWIFKLVHHRRPSQQKFRVQGVPHAICHKLTEMCYVH